MANRHLPPLVPNQGPGGSRRTGPATSKAVGAQYPAFRADNGAPTRRGRVDRVGLVAVNPPFTLERDLRSLMPDLCRLLSPDAAARADWLVAERVPGR